MSAMPPIDVQALIRQAAEREGVTVDEILERLFPGSKVDISQIKVSEAKVEIKKFDGDDTSQEPVETIVKTYNK